MADWHKDPTPINNDLTPEDSGSLLFIIFSLVTCLLMLTVVVIVGMAV